MTGPARRWLSAWLIAALVGLMGAAPASAALFEEDFMNNGGYYRQYVSMNLQDVPETFDDDRYNLNMVRSQVLLESDFELRDWAQVHSRLRGAREYKTGYLNTLQNPNGPDGTFGTSDDEMSAFANQPGVAVVPRNGAATTEFYEKFLGKNDLEVRELYLDLDLTRSTSLRAGKQMMSWGKGSFQRALDLVQGFDNSWAPIITDEQERRKSTIMLNLRTDLPGWGGSLQAYYQPGYDDLHDLGTTDPGFGGRYTANGLRGINTNEPLNVSGVLTGQLVILPEFNEDGPGSEVDKERFGLRFQGMGFGNQVEYSLAYMHTNQKSAISHTVITPYQSDTIPATDPRCPAPSPGGNLDDDVYAGQGYTGCLQSGERRERLLPIIDIVGGSFNYYSPLLDVVTRGEVAYLKDRVFDRFTEDATLRSQLASLDQALLGVFTDQIKKDEYRLMLGFDRTAYFTQTLLGADRPGLITVEFFDFYIDDFDEDEFITDSSHFLRKEHTLEYVMNLRWSYANGYVAPDLVVAGDASYGGNWFANPGFTISPTTNWRITLDGVFVFEDTQVGNNATRYGFNGQGDRITTQVTYQF